MNRDRNANIRERQQENRKLEEQTKRMEEELQKILKLKQIENDRLKLKAELDQLTIANQVEEAKQSKDSQKLRSNGQINQEYAETVNKEHTEEVQKRLLRHNKMMQKRELEEESEKEEDNEDGENMKYFLSVIGLSSHFEALAKRKILKIENLRGLKETQLKEMNITVKDHVKIIKKLRAMGI